MPFTVASFYQNVAEHFMLYTVTVWKIGQCPDVYNVHQGILPLICTF